MNCPTCSHAMGRLTINEGLDFSHCERCGTVVVTDIAKEAADWEVGQRSVYVPKLVEQCRSFDNELYGQYFGERDWGAIFEDWHVIGIRESIYSPEDRRGRDDG